MLSTIALPTDTRRELADALLADLAAGKAAVARELDRATGWSLGLVFARGDLTLAEVQRVVLGKEAR